MDQSALTAGGYVMTEVLMVIGVAPSSTGGGIKLATLVVVFASLRTSLVGGGDYNLCKKGISTRTFNKAISILIFYILALISGVMLICLTDSAFSLEQIVFECISALSNVGVTMGITTSLSEVGRMILIVLMYLGRAGFLCVVYSLANNNKPNIKYPDGKIVIG